MKDGPTFDNGSQTSTLAVSFGVRELPSSYSKLNCKNVELDRHLTVNFYA